MKLRTIIVDDEPKNRRVLMELLSRYCPEVTIIGDAGSLTEAVTLIHKSTPDLVLLDIEMPGGNGFDLIDKLKPINFEVIFVTAFDAYAIKAFKYSALDYLLKPVNIEEMQKSIAKVLERIHLKSVNMRLMNLSENRSSGESENQKMALQIPGKDLEFVNIADILYFESNGGYTNIFAETGRKYISSRTLKDFEELLPDSIFFRIHHSCLVNIKKVSKYLKGRGGSVEMVNGKQLEVATRRKEELLVRLKVK
ncbi:MAG: response regulator transcription factor [Chitinophagaceae bacterium]|nr:response regulator transcription factor [Chitinophagaceae bacterium]